MFENVGNELKELAKLKMALIVFAVGVVGLIVLFNVINWFDGISITLSAIVLYAILIGLTVAIAKIMVLKDYAFGELVDQSMEINKKFVRSLRINEEIVNDTITANKKLEQIANQNTLILAELRKTTQEQ